jgi:hypothetical protein
MFRASLCPSTGALDPILLYMVFSTSYAGWYLGKPPESRPCALCAHGLLSGFLRLQPAHLVPKTICRNIGLALLKMGIMMPETF